MPAPVDKTDKEYKILTQMFIYGTNAAPLPRVHSAYVPARDGVRLAVDVWLPAQNVAPFVTALTVTRYWRSWASDANRVAGPQPARWTRAFLDSGFAVVVADARGSGASFGHRDGAFCSTEIDDLEALVGWIIAQSWSGGSVITFGTSFAANTALLAACGRNSRLRAVLARFPDFDLFSQTLCPGGISCIGLNTAWGSYTAALDRGDRPKTPGRALPEADEHVQRPRAVDGDSGDFLQQALAQHGANFDFLSASDARLSCRDVLPSNVTGLPFSAAALDVHGNTLGRADIPVLYWAGWFDAGTALGAIDFHRMHTGPHRVVIGPWNHGMGAVHDPLQPVATPVPIEFESKATEAFERLAPLLRSEAEVEVDGQLEYYVLGAGEWRTTRVWPPKEVAYRSLWLGQKHTLEMDPQKSSGRHRYHWRKAHTTGSANRWRTQLDGRLVRFDDRREADELCLVYESAPLAEAAELIGAPALDLWLRSSRDDGLLFAYLEIVAPDGEVRVLTEGQLRLQHRAPVLACVDDPSFGRSRLLSENLRSMPLAEAERIQLSLLPTAARVPARWRLRIAIASADATNFASALAPDAGFYDVHYGSRLPSALLLPLSGGALELALNPQES